MASRKDQLTQHLKRHNQKVITQKYQVENCKNTDGRFECHVCRKNYSQLRNLKAHIREKHTITPKAHKQKLRQVRPPEQKSDGHGTFKIILVNRYTKTNSNGHHKDVTVPMHTRKVWQIKKLASEPETQPLQFVKPDGQINENE